MKVICINDRDRPNGVPSSSWVKKGEKYTIILVKYMRQQNTYGCKLAEINNDAYYPYSYFALSRFAISVDEITKAVEDNKLELETV